MKSDKDAQRKGLVRVGDLLKDTLPDRLPVAPVATAAAHPPLKPTEFANKQLHLFQNILCNTEEERERFSNAIDLWDSIPRYAVSRQAMARARTSGKFLENHTSVFHYRERTYAVTISPARVTDLDGQQRDYYPSTTEELVEESLRKLALEQQQGFFDKPSYRSGVLFTIYALREELARCGHARSYQEIVLALNILSKSTIEIRENGKGELLAISPYLPALVAVSHHKLRDDPKARWAAQFHPFVTESIDKGMYRQYDYDAVMSYDGRLARWLHKYLVLKYTFADLSKPFRMHYTTIKRDSGLLNEYSRERAAIDAVKEAFSDLQQKGVLISCERNNITGPRKKLLDVVFIVWPSLDFIKEVKAANKRQLLSSQQEQIPGKR